MNDVDRLREEVSAFMDAEGEVDTESNTKTTGCWERYHLIGDAIRNNAPELMAGELASKVRASIKNEPVILAPRNLKTHSKRKRLAVAAGVAGALAAGTLVWLNQTPEQSEMVTKNTITPLADTNTTHIVIESGNRIERSNDPKLNSYITRHDASVLHVEPTKFPHVKVVAYPE